MSLLFKKAMFPLEFGFLFNLKFFVELQITLCFWFSCTSWAVELQVCTIMANPYSDEAEPHALYTVSKHSANGAVDITASQETTVVLWMGIWDMPFLSSSWSTDKIKFLY